MHSTEQTPAHVVHELLAHSYLTYLAAILVGFVASRLMPFPLLEGFFVPAGLCAMAMGSAIVFWSQHSSHERHHAPRVPASTLTVESFLTGPYRYSRIPTQYGLFFLTLGLSFVYLSLAMTIATLVAFALVLTVFIPREEAHLARKYGQPFRDYLKQVRF